MKIIEIGGLEEETKNFALPINTCKLFRLYDNLPWLSSLHKWILDFSSFPWSLRLSNLEFKRESYGLGKLERRIGNSECEIFIVQSSPLCQISQSLIVNAKISQSLFSDYENYDFGSNWKDRSWQTMVRFLGLSKKERRHKRGLFRALD